MKSTGIVRKVDELGRVVLPIEIRRTLDIAERDEIEIFMENDRIILQKYQPSCIFCNNAELFHFSYRRYIENCLREAFGFKGTPIQFVIRERTKEEA